MNIIIVDDRVAVETESGTARGRYYYKNGELKLVSQSALGLARLIKFKKEIELEVERLAK